MSPKIPSLPAAGLAVLGLCWAALRGVAAPQDPPAPPAPASASPSPSAPVEEAPPTVLLLSSGVVLHGEITQDPSGYWLKSRLGTQHHPRRSVLGAFHSVEDAYQFRLGRLPKDDADEQLKLAKWCQVQRLDEHAETHLGEVLKLNPEHKQARAMLFYLQARSAPAADPNVARTGAEVSADADNEPAPGMPRELNPTALDRLRTLNSERRPVGPPIIFDLPPAVAVRRYDEFKKTIHVELQTHCAKCHDADNYSGAYRLVRARTRRDLVNDLLVRTNLDATLQLVNPSDLAHSELLSVAALTHPPDGRPVLGGPNHPSYRVFLNWVGGLQDSTRAPRPEPVVPTRYAPSAAPGESFAVGRMDQAQSGPSPTDPPYTIGAPITAPPNIVNGFTAREQGVHPDVPPGTQFPDPAAIPAPRPAGALPNLPPTAVSPPQAAPTAPQPPAAQAGQPGAIVTRPDGSQGIVLPNGAVAPFVSRQALRSNPSKAPAPQAPATPANPDTTKAETKAKVKIDPAALQQFMQNRGGPK